MDKNYKNIISVRGTIVSIHTDMRKTTMRIATDGGSGKGLDSEDKSYYPEIVFYTTNIGERFSVRRDHVEIKAHIHTWYNRNEKKNVTEYVGDSIVRTSRFLADYFSNIDEEGANPDDENIVILSGKVSRIDKRDSGGNLVVLSISIPDKENESHVDNCRVTCFRKNAQYAHRNLAKGDFVAVGGRIHTSRNRETGEPMQNVVCRDIAKLKA